MAGLNGKPAIIIDKRLGTDASPHVSISEPLIINTDAKVILSEIPLEYNGVTVSGQNKTWYEIKKGLPNINQYIVDYVNKIITFNASNIGKQLNFQYTGTGNHYYSTSSIYTEENNGVVTETLKKLIDDLKVVGSIAVDNKDEIVRSEEIRKSNETTRILSENTRVANETARKTSEDNRVTNENQRKQNETARQQNETLRQQQESKRQTDSATAIVNVESVAQNASSIIGDFSHKGAYSSVTTYSPRNIVSYQGSSYINTATSLNVLPTDSSKWKLIASQGLQGIKGDPGDKGDTGSVSEAWQGAYNNTKAYVKGNLTSYNGRVYIALQSTTGNLPTNNSYWDIFSDKGADGTGSVNSVNGKTGVVTINAQEIGALPESQKGVAGGLAKLDASGNVVDANGNQVKGAITSVNGQTGIVTIPGATTSVDGLLSSADKTKLNGIATGANNYSHPSTHPASIITQDASNRFVTDTEKATWNAKETTTGAQGKANTAETNAKNAANLTIGDLTNLATNDKATIVNAINEVWVNSGSSKPKIYGVRIDKSNSNPETAVTYIDDALGMSGNSTLWDEIFPFNQIKPCVFLNGAVNYYLNPNDLTKKSDGTSSDITSGSAGDIMIEYPKFFWKITSNDKEVLVRYSAKQVDETWKPLAHTKGTVIKDNVYLGAYLGFSQSSKLRSLSGKTPTANQTIGSFRTLAQANGVGYQQMGYYQLLMLQVLYIVRYKSLDSQTALGRGYVDGNAATNATGGTNLKGMNFGETTGKQQMKFSGIEDFWGNSYYWIDGLFCDSNRNILINNQNFSDSGTGYVNCGQGAPTNIGGYINDIQGTTETGFIMKASSGSSTTYYSDYGNMTASCLPIFGGDWSDTSRAGTFQLSVNFSASYLNSIITSRLAFV